MRPPAPPNTTLSENAAQPTRYVTHEGVTWVNEQTPESTPPDPGMEEAYRIYRLCLCGDCAGSGKREGKRCKDCRGEGRSLELVATATDPESVGVALITLAGEGEFDECPIGLMFRPEGQTGKWLIKPWLPSARNLSDAGRVLQTGRHQ
jgi:hypothetical protein